MAVTVRTLENFVGGEWVAASGDGGREIVSPVTGEKLADAPDATAEDVERAARAQGGLQALRWPDPFPFDSSLAQLAATYAKAGGKTVAFCLAAFRQAYAGGRSLAEEENVMIAAAACEIHPRALLKALETRSIAQRLDEATATARDRGVVSTPAFFDGERVHHGDDVLEDVASRMTPAA